MCKNAVVSVVLQYMFVEMTKVVSFNRRFYNEFVTEEDCHVTWRACLAVCSNY